MFTGLVSHQGIVRDVSALGKGKKISFFYTDIPLKEGDSLCINGVCSTVTDVSDDYFNVDYLEESLKKSTLGRLKKGEGVNFELSLLPTSRMGGHFVTGHVDGVGEIKSVSDDGPWHVLDLYYPPQFAHYLVEKGSICIDGVSLTVVDVYDDYFSCHIIPHTFNHTIFSKSKEHDKVNLEFDLLAKYMYRFYSLKKNK